MFGSLVASSYFTYGSDQLDDAARGHHARAEHGVVLLYLCYPTALQVKEWDMETGDTTNLPTRRTG